MRLSYLWKKIYMPLFSNTIHGFSMNERIDLYKQHLNLPNATFSLIEHEEAMVATVFKITSPYHAPFILKISERPNDYFREALFLKKIAESLPVPKIIQLIEPTSDIHGAILM